VIQVEESPLAVADKSSWVKVSSVLIIPNPLFSSPALLLFCQMSPLRRQSTIFLQAKLTEEFTPESPWTDGVISASFHNEPFSLLEGTAGPLDAPPMPTTDHLLLSYDDDIGPPSATSGDAERVNFADFTMDASNMSYGDQPDDLYATFSLSLSLSTHDD